MSVRWHFWKLLHLYIIFSLHNILYNWKKWPYEPDQHLTSCRVPLRTGYFSTLLYANTFYIRQFPNQEFLWSFWSFFHSLLFKTSQGQWNSHIHVLGAPMQPSLDLSFSLLYIHLIFLSFWGSPVPVWVTGSLQSFWVELKFGPPGPTITQPLSPRHHPPCFSTELSTAIALEHLRCKGRGDACPCKGPQFYVKLIQKHLGEGNQHISTGNVSKGKIQRLLSSGFLILYMLFPGLLSK